MGWKIGANSPAPHAQVYHRLKGMMCLERVCVCVCPVTPASDNWRKVGPARPRLSPTGCCQTGLTGWQGRDRAHLVNDNIAPTQQSLLRENSTRSIEGRVYAALFITVWMLWTGLSVKRALRICARGCTIFLLSNEHPYDSPLLLIHSLTYSHPRSHHTNSMLPHRHDLWFCSLNIDFDLSLCASVFLCFLYLQYLFCCVPHTFINQGWVIQR